MVSLCISIYRRGVLFVLLSSVIPYLIIIVFILSYRIIVMVDVVVDVVVTLLLWLLCIRTKITPRIQIGLMYDKICWNGSPIRCLYPFTRFSENLHDFFFGGPRFNLSNHGMIWMDGMNE